jgi:transcriptional regulator with XRE-family HTH domain
LDETALAKKAGLTKARLNEIEAGKSESKLLELARLAKALGVTTEAPLAGAGL